MKRRTRAEKILELMDITKPGNALSMTMYDGNDILEAQTVETRMKVMCKTGEKIPLPLVTDLALDISCVQLENDSAGNAYRVIVEGVVVRLKEGEVK